MLWLGFINIKFRKQYIVTLLIICMPCFFIISLHSSGISPYTWDTTFLSSQTKRLLFQWFAATYLKLCIHIYWSWRKVPKYIIRLENIKILVLAHAHYSVEVRVFIILLSFLHLKIISMIIFQSFNMKNDSSIHLSLHINA